jgi:hypothetical protein
MNACSVLLKAYPLALAIIGLVWPATPGAQGLSTNSSSQSPSRTGSSEEVLVRYFESAKPQVIAQGVGATEGPTWCQQGFLLFSDIQGNRILRWTPDRKVEVFRRPSNISNGLSPNCADLVLMTNHSSR